jgi:hypothetical protein
LTCNRRSSRCSGRVRLCILISISLQCQMELCLVRCDGWEALEQFPARLRIHPPCDTTCAYVVQRSFLTAATSSTTSTCAGSFASQTPYNSHVLCVPCSVHLRRPQHPRPRAPAPARLHRVRARQAPRPLHPRQLSQQRRSESAARCVSWRVWPRGRLESAGVRVCGGCMTERGLSQRRAESARRHLHGSGAQQAAAGVAGIGMGGGLADRCMGLLRRWPGAPGDWGGVGMQLGWRMPGSATHMHCELLSAWRSGAQSHWGAMRVAE